MATSTKRTCSECGREFPVSSRHKRCVSCRPRKTVKCAECGKPLHYGRKRCINCHNKVVPRRKQREVGYRKLNSSGYVLIYMPDHPSANTKYGYVFEHRLVMEKKLGRLLKPDENVHHKNGIKDDNRPSNLELWKRGQPNGARVEDLVEWAKELLAEYEPEALA